jgi:hypothetical protein
VPEERKELMAPIRFDCGEGKVSIIVGLVDEKPALLLGHFSRKKALGLVKRYNRITPEMAESAEAIITVGNERSHTVLATAVMYLYRWLLPEEGTPR